MKTLKTFLLAITLRGGICLSLLLMLSGVSYGQSCADGSASYTDDVLPILSAKCSPCHTTNSTSGFNLNTYAGLLAGGTNCGAGVTAGDATLSSLIDKTQWVNGGGVTASCGSNMPTSGAGLTTAEFALIEAWVNAGAQENCPMAVPCDLYIAGVLDGPLTGGTPKGVQLCATNDIADLSIYGIGSANNGGGSDGEEFTLPAVPLAAGECIWIASEATEFENFFGAGCMPDYVDGAANVNGDDAIELFANGAVIDTYGDINTDGTGQPWEYLDGWATATDTECNGGTFTGTNWTFSGINALDGETDNGTAANPYPNPPTCAPVACAIAADLMVAPAAPVVVESTCQADGVTVDGGSIAAITCPTDATAEYSIDGGTTWTTTVPTYDQTTAITVTVRCLCDEDMTTASPTAEVTTVPGMCTVCEITDISAAPPVCSADGLTYTITVTVTGVDANNTVTLDDAGSTEMSQAATGTVVFTYADDASYNITVTDTDAECTFPAITGGPVNCTVLSCGTCTEGSAGLVITELSYDPATTQGNDGDCEYIELFNSYSNSITLDANTTLELSNGASFTFPPGTTIAPGEYIIIAINPTGFGTCTWATPPPAGTQIFGPTTGSLSNAGESVDITLACASNPAVDFTQSVAFSDGTTPTAGGGGDAVYYPLDGTGPLASAPTPGSGDCTGCAMTEFLCETVACAIAPDLMVAPAAPVVVESTCQADGVTVDGGSIAAITCPTDATAEYSIDGGTTWTTTVPAYDQTTAVTVTVRCLCDEDMMTASPTAEVTTVPGECVITCAIEADLATAPAAPVVVESTCQADGTTVDGGSIAPITCPAGATAEYSTDGGTTWVTTVPTYDQTNPVTVTVRCLCDEDMMTASPVTAVTTVPGACACDISNTVFTQVCTGNGEEYELCVSFDYATPGASGQFNVYLDPAGTGTPATIVAGPFNYADYDAAIAGGATCFTVTGYMGDATDLEAGLEVCIGDADAPAPGTGLPPGSTPPEGGIPTFACPQVYGILHNACAPAGGEEGPNEFVVIVNGAEATPVSAFDVDTPSGNDYDDFNTTAAPASWTCPCCTYLDETGTVPAGGVVVVTSAANVSTLDFTSLCSAAGTIYVLQDDGIGTTGHFSNSGPRSTFLNLTGTTSCDGTTSYTYTNADGIDGDYTSFAGPDNPIATGSGTTATDLGTPNPGNIDSSGDCTPQIAPATEVECFACGTLDEVACMTCPMDIEGMLGDDALVCSDDNAVDLMVVITGTGTGPYTVTYNDGAMDIVVTGYNDGDAIPISPTATTTYTLVSITDANGCTGIVSGEALITVNDPPNAGMAGAAMACSNAADGNTIVDLDGSLTGMPDVAGVWMEVTSSGVSLANTMMVDFDGVAPGMYTFTYTVPGDGICQDAMADVVVTVADCSVPCPDITADIAADATVCADNTASTLTITIVGGTGPYTIMYSDGTTQTVTNYNSGDAIAVSPTATTTYMLTGVMDANMCAATFGTTDATITVVDLPVAGTTTPAMACNDSAEGISVVDLNGTLTGADAGTWSETTASGVSLADPTMVDFSGVAPGTYTFVYTVAATAPCTMDAMVSVDIMVADCAVPGCTLVLAPETVVCDAETAGVDTYTVSIPFDNGAEGAPGMMGYTITTSGTLGGDNPMTAQSGTITITFNEGAAYDYSIQGTAGNANELCDFSVNGASPTCEPMVCEDEIAGMVVADASCDLSGITVTITDAAGNVITTLTTDSAGIYDSTPAVFPCGNYFAELTAGIPTCYGDGETGPKAFVIDGDPAMADTDGPNFGAIASIPTVGEWGLIILALLMSIVAVVGIRERKASEVNA